LGLTEIMVKDISNFSQEELLEISKEINKSPHNLFKLLNNLLDWARMQQGTVTFHPAEIILSDLILQNIDLVAMRAEQKKIELIVEIPKNYKVYADEAMLNSIIRNFISNAVKFTKPNGKIKVSAKKTESNTMEISVTDSGIGIPELLAKNLFKIDEKVKRKGTDGEESTGLGLLLCKEFVGKNGGTIWVESEEENIETGKLGRTTFTFTLPCV